MHKFAFSFTTFGWKLNLCLSAADLRYFWTFQPNIFVHIYDRMLMDVSWLVIHNFSALFY